MKDLHDENIIQYYNPIVGKIFSNKGLKVEKIKEKKQNEIMFFVKKKSKKEGPVQTFRMYCQLVQ